ncbi:unnamed protein product [Cuscuta epithymum]|uniref:Protein FAR1-RELATED SEQUENCE n=1 Tax=Cuscuta epithymum TaxID=186058 RepID=A0AAV0EUN2_9ASTE|nr:unnamed protein product [Cuscuta epithymum]
MCDKFEMEKQFQNVYTIKKFKEFQRELTGKLYCEVDFIEMIITRMFYEVREYLVLGDTMHRKVFKVILEKENNAIVCHCHLFEFRGILCRHDVTVLIREGTTTIPDRYILKRWRNDVFRPYTRLKINYNGWVSVPGQLQYEKLCHKFSEIAHIVVGDESLERVTFEWLNSYQKSLIPHSNSGTNKTDSRCQSVDRVFGVLIKDPKCTRRKGAPKKLRKKSLRIRIKKEGGKGEEGAPKKLRKKSLRIRIKKEGGKGEEGEELSS